MADNSNFISQGSIEYATELNKLYTDLKKARDNRGWTTSTSFTNVTANSTETSTTALNTLKTIVGDNGQKCRYVYNFPAFTANFAQRMRANFFNEIQLAINDINNLVGCSSGCTGVCIGCSGTCSGSSCSGTCGSSCVSRCGSDCSATCQSACKTYCNAACGGTCASGCSGCRASCKGGSE